MPFTATHVAAALPIAWLCRWRLPFSALAIGCVVPDIPVFYPHLLSYTATHSLVGILTHCTPIGVVLYYLYQSLFKQPLSDLLPRSFSERLWPWVNRPINFSLTAIISVLVCIALGSATHVLWDSFTHYGRWGVMQFPWLNSIAFQVGNFPIAWYSVVQHASSLLLLPPMLLGFVLWVFAQTPDTRQREHFQFPRRVAWSVIAVILVGMAVHFCWIYDSMPHATLLRVVRESIRIGGAVVMLITLLYCFAMHMVWSARRRQRDRTQASLIAAGERS
ncbi:DUF4184 family protein [Novipirellula artificiosorum]|uniref:DUF4184 family protein n=1 Tax=Novipirellula artificiosorum TaxID=2528016 RepID=A0A5C6DH77_9BACT|nr:DUF4184 family protein [Novipirellula artificiosorum]TWU36210.1 hypothetical protein Poly41_39640 [Novipirellula artificiosorum]